MKLTKYLIVMASLDHHTKHNGVTPHGQRPTYWPCYERCETSARISHR